jgi:hypothetical protein
MPFVAFQGTAVETADRRTLLRFERRFVVVMRRRRRSADGRAIARLVVWCLEQILHLTDETGARIALNGDDVVEEDDVNTELDDLERAVRMGVATRRRRGGGRSRRQVEKIDMVCARVRLRTLHLMLFKPKRVCLQSRSNFRTKMVFIRKMSAIR